MKTISKQELKDFKKNFAQSQTKLKNLEGIRGGSSAVSEMLINFGYVWIDRFNKWVYKSSNFTDREQEILDQLREEEN